MLYMPIQKLKVLPAGLLSQGVDGKCTSLHLEVGFKMLHHQLWHFFGARTWYGDSQAVLGAEPCAVSPWKIQVD